MPVLENVSMARGKEVIYGIRPEHLVTNQGGTSAKVSVIESTGAETQITANLGTAQIVATVRERLDLRASDVITVKPDLTEMHLFDVKTEKRLSAS